MSFVDQALSHGVFNSIVRPSQQKLGTRLTKRTVTKLTVVRYNFNRQELSKGLLNSQNGPNYPIAPGFGEQTECTYVLAILVPVPSQK